MKSKIVNALGGLALLSIMALVGSNTVAGATVVTFDDLTGHGQLPNGYAGIIWNDQWHYYNDSGPSFFDYRVWIRTCLRRDWL